MDELILVFTRDRGRSFLLCFIMTCIFNIYELSNYEISVDDEVQYEGGLGVSNWWYSVGRWGAGLIASMPLPSFVVPYATELLFCISLASAYLLICDMHAIRTEWKMVVLLPLFVLCPTWAFIESFYSILPAVSLGLVLTVSAAYLTFKSYCSRMSSPKGLDVTIIAILSFAFGCYQSLILLYMAIGAGKAIHGIYAIHSSPTCKISAGRLISHYAAFGLIATVLSICFARLFQVVLGIEQSPYLDSFISLSDFSFLKLPRYFIDTVKQVWFYFGGRKNVYGYSFNGMLFLTSAACFSFGLTVVQGRRKLLMKSMLFASLLTSPFLFTFFGGNLPTRSLLSIPYISWLISLIVLTVVWDVSRNRILRLSFAILVAWVLLQSIYINGSYGAASALVKQHDTMLAASIYNRLQLVGQGYGSLDEMQLGISGKINYKSPFPTGVGSTIGISIFDWDGGNSVRMVAYMRMLGYQRLKLLDDSMISNKSDLLASMDKWPAPGSLVKVDTNKFLLKLSEVQSMAKAVSNP